MVRSILGQFLEHSRIISFRALNETFIGSADMMHRNLDRRVEVMAQVKDARLTAYLHSVNAQLPTVNANFVPGTEPQVNPEAKPRKGNKDGKGGKRRRGNEQ